MSGRLREELRLRADPGRRTDAAGLRGRLLGRRLEAVPSCVARGALRFRNIWLLHGGVVDESARRSRRSYAIIFCAGRAGCPWSSRRGGGATGVRPIGAQRAAHRRSLPHPAHRCASSASSQSRQNRAPRSSLPRGYVSGCAPGAACAQNSQASTSSVLITRRIEVLTCGDVVRGRHASPQSDKS